MNSSAYKQSIVESFSQRASIYDLHATVQQRSAELLAQFIQNEFAKVPDGEILEVGCGTGIFSKYLLQIFPERKLLLSDASAAMLAQCRIRLLSDASVADNGLEQQIRHFTNNSFESDDPHFAKHSADLQFVELDAENFVSEKKFALICASFSLQWMSEFEQTVERLLNALQPKGRLLFSIPIQGSFEEWRRQCRASDIPFTANVLPSKQELIKWCRRENCTINWSQHQIQTNFNSTIEFFRSLKRVGAAVNTSGMQLSPKELRQLARQWDERSGCNVSVTYEVLCASISREYDR